MQSEAAGLGGRTGGEADASDGGFYVQDVDFRSGVVGVQSPMSMALTAAVGGVVPPDPSAAFTYCDLGCGDGTTVNAFAELYPHATFVGIDFNPGHIRTAQETAAACGLDNVRFVQARFSDLANLDDLPVFDFIGMNGIYAWLEEDEAQAARRFVGDHLRAGGLFYVEYTCLPGKVSVQPLWKLIQTLTPPRPGEDSRERARRGLDLTEALAKRGMAYLAAHRPAANGAQGYIRGRKVDEYRVDHFAHNAMASGFRPRYVTDMFAEMASVGLTYAARSELALNDLELSVPAAQVPTFQDYRDDVGTVELLKDYIRNEQQRHDVFVKDGAPDRAAADAWLDAVPRLMLRMPADGVTRHIQAPGNARIPLRGPAYDALITAVDAKAQTVADVAAASGQPVERVRRAAVRLLASHQMVACRTGAIEPVPEPGTVAGLTIPGRMNRRTLRLAAERLLGNQLVSPVTGTASIPVSPLEAVLLQAVVDVGVADAPPAARDRLASETRPLPGPGGQKPARDITADDLNEVLGAMRGRKLYNMLRLGIVAPA
ncbi:class I SAM-dependent methyltransferase [Roseospira goensis]|uniref:SAM-dependent methyltransferase n=1 Tax=Roseospira goensis TaxID=391922 RepID=A0A7W6RYM2_9PROT|nr:class I SAM-dependent methyltransferase [Roseospira goensis]MBB4285547.1 SAM-dependent methyltransferase [Roseospira goensis]